MELGADDARGRAPAPQLGAGRLDVGGVDDEVAEQAIVGGTGGDRGLVAGSHLAEDGDRGGGGGAHTSGDKDPAEP